MTSTFLPFLFSPPSLAGLYHSVPRSRCVVDACQFSSNSQTLHVCHLCLHWGGLGGQCRHIWHTSVDLINNGEPETIDDGAESTLDEGVLPQERLLERSEEE